MKTKVIYMLVGWYFITINLLAFTFIYQYYQVNFCNSEISYDTEVVKAMKKK